MRASATFRTSGAGTSGASAAARAAPVRRMGGALVMAAVMAVSGCSAAGTTGDDPAPATSATSGAVDAVPSGAAARYDAATRDDAAFNATFSHEFADVDGVRTHYVTGGSGPPLVLLHGWPQSWFEWREVMPALAEEHTVYAVDLPGLGDSEGEPSGYDKATLARYVHGLVSFYPLVASGGTGCGGPGAEQPFTDAQIDEFARTYQRPQVLSGGFDVHAVRETPPMIRWCKNCKKPWPPGVVGAS